MTEIDLTWRPVAEATRDALALLGHPIESPCLPHEAEPCGAGYGLHAAAHLAVIKAIAEHQLGRLGMPGVAAEIYEHELAQLRHTGTGAGFGRT
jgi:hypothetical protein